MVVIRQSCLKFKCVGEKAKGEEFKHIMELNLNYTNRDILNLKGKLNVRYKQINWFLKVVLFLDSELQVKTL